MKGITRIPYPETYDQWVDLRHKVTGKGDPNLIRFGGSDIGTIMDKNPYETAAEFFYKACDFYPRPRLMKLELLRGHIQEEVIAKEYFQYWDPENPDNETFLENYYGEKKIFRKPRQIKAMLLNSDYPLLVANMDYVIESNKYHADGLLECKSPTWRALEKWEAGISPSYVLQPYSYMMVSRKEYSELFMVKDATYPEAYTFTPNEEIYNNIDKATKAFAELVLAGKEIVYSDLSDSIKELRLSEMAPEPSGEKSYTDFLLEKHRPENATVEIDGTPEQLRYVISFLKEKRRLDKWTKRMKVREQKIRRWFVGDIGTISFGEIGKISWKSKLNIPMRLLNEFEDQ